VTRRANPADPIKRAGTRAKVAEENIVIGSVNLSSFCGVVCVSPSREEQKSVVPKDAFTRLILAVRVASRPSSPVWNLFTDAHPSHDQARTHQVGSLTSPLGGT
jgi:hypothetical protein